MSSRRSEKAEKLVQKVEKVLAGGRVVIPTGPDPTDGVRGNQAGIRDSRAEVGLE